MFIFTFEFHYFSSKMTIGALRKLCLPRELSQRLSFFNDEFIFWFTIEQKDTFFIPGTLFFKLHPEWVSFVCLALKISPSILLWPNAVFVRADLSCFILIVWLYGFQCYLLPYFTNSRKYPRKPARFYPRKHPRFNSRKPARFNPRKPARSKSW